MIKVQVLGMIELSQIKFFVSQRSRRGDLTGSAGSLRTDDNSTARDRDYLSERAGLTR
jgi:hypothetical protein